jgi:hypothetical protein
MIPLILKRTSANRPSAQWRDDDYVVLENGVVVGRIFKVPVAPSSKAAVASPAFAACSSTHRAARDITRTGQCAPAREQGRDFLIA